MVLILTVLEIVAPVFLLATIGFAWVRLGFEYRVEFVIQLAMTVSLPCLIFVALMRAEIEPAALTALSLAVLTAHAIVALAFLALVLVARLEMRTYLAPLTFGNTGNLGLPLALFAFGETGLGYAAVVFAISTTLVFTFGLWVVSGGGSPLRVFKEPLVGATLLGGLFLWNDWQTPLWLTNSLELIGQMSIPLMLLTLGVAVARLHPERVTRAVWLSLFKVITCAAIAWGVGRWVALDRIAFAILVLQMSTPVAVTSYLLAQKYAPNADEVAGLVVISTLLSVLSLPLLLGMLI